MFELISPDSPVVPVKVELTYDRRDPYPVQASFRTGHGTAVDSGRIELELNYPSGHALFTTSARTLGEFLDRTYEAVPPSTEYSWLDFDMALSDLLANDCAHD